MPKISSVGKYTLEVVYTMDDNSKIVIGTTEIVITENGELNISEVLIDPYGTIKDKVTGLPVSGVNVVLYYADTAKNIAAGKTPNTPVVLPPVVNFPPANNANPQTSDAGGQYAYMVYSQTDYYIVGTKAGYYDAVSGTISVFDTIVNYDFQMTPIPVPTGGSGSSSGSKPDKSTEYDLAITIEADTMKMGEKTDGGFTVKYVNRTEKPLEEALVSVIVPEGMTVKDSGGGTVSGSQITWIVKNLEKDEIGTLRFILTAQEINSKEVKKNVSAAITSENPLINTEDDASYIYVLVYSNRFEGTHKRYIKGYPDGTFKENNNITRSEVAAIFARLLNLDVSNSSTGYSDVSDN